MQIRSGRDAEAVGGERRAEAAEAGDHLVEDQQDVVLVADRPQALQIALRRDQHAGRAGHRLDDHRGDVGGVVQGDDPLQVVGQVAPCSGWPLANRLPATPWVWGRWSTPVSREPKYIRFLGMPPTEMPPKPTP
jgi:hypothetical protein